MNTWNEVWKVTDDLIRSTTSTTASSTLSVPSSTSPSNTVTSSTSSLIKINIPFGSALKSIFTQEEVSTAKETLFNKLDAAVELNITSSTISIVIIVAIVVLGIVSLVISKLKLRKQGSQEVRSVHVAKPDYACPNHSVHIASAPVSENEYAQFSQQQIIDSVTSSINTQDEDERTSTIMSMRILA